MSWDWREILEVLGAIAGLAYVAFQGWRAYNDWRAQKHREAMHEQQGQGGPVLHPHMQECIRCGGLVPIDLPYVCKPRRSARRRAHDAFVRKSVYRGESPADEPEPPTSCGVIEQCVVEGGFVGEGDACERCRHTRGEHDVATARKTAAGAAIGGMIGTIFGAALSSMGKKSVPETVPRTQCSKCGAFDACGEPRPGFMPDSRERAVIIPCKECGHEALLPVRPMHAPTAGRPDAGACPHPADRISPYGVCTRCGSVRCHDGTWEPPMSKGTESGGPR